MFDVERLGERPLAKGRRGLGLGLTIAAHAVVLGLVAALPFLQASDELPPIPDTLAFVAPAVPAPPPPAPPAPSPPKSAPRPVATTGATPRPAQPAVRTEPAPVEAPSEVGREMPIAPAPPRGEIDAHFDRAVGGGVEGGVPGGVIGGIVGGLPDSVAPPPPPKPPAPKTPVRVGGQIATPALLSRVAPQFPEAAARAGIRGAVILEATVDKEGHVESVRVVKSVSQLDKAAVDAVGQWRYSPLLLNGEPRPFIVTVTVSFND